MTGAPRRSRGANRSVQPLRVICEKCGAGVATATPENGRILWEPKIAAQDAPVVQTPDGPVIRWPSKSAEHQAQAMGVDRVRSGQEVTHKMLLNLPPRSGYVDELRELIGWCANDGRPITVSAMAIVNAIETRRREIRVW